MKYIEFILEGTCIGFGVFAVLAGIGASVKFTQWLGKKLGVPPLSL